MGTRGREIIGMDVEQLLKLLNQAYASEWLAYYQYWLGAKVIKGPMKDAVAAELNLHATEELNHAVLLASRIIQLGGTPGHSRRHSGSTRAPASTTRPTIPTWPSCSTRTSPASSAPSRPTRPSWTPPRTRTW